ncbi:unnamed protein product [Amoebophrya sp. A25]|nr:unnamed protein product [Amoebophrya sp. A25]|eukprot:GSA25T00009440001.1
MSSGKIIQIRSNNTRFNRNNNRKKNVTHKSAIFSRLARFSGHCHVEGNCRAQEQGFSGFGHRVRGVIFRLMPLTNVLKQPCILNTSQCNKRSQHDLFLMRREAPL